MPVHTGKTSVPDHEDVYYEGTISLRDLAGIDGVLHFTQGAASVLIERINPGKPIKIKPGQLVGTVSTIVDVEINVAVESAQWTRTELEEHVDVSQLPEEQRTIVLDLILQRSGVLSRSGDDIGCAGVTQHTIELHDTTPIRQRPRQFPEPVAQEVERQCQELKQLDIIEYSKSPWSSPVVPVRKKDNTIRLCVDYRQLNRVTKADRFPLPNMSELVYCLFGVKFFSILDLRKGYYQVPLHPDSRECTAFSTSYNHYQCKRLPFGLKNAPGAFQREMQIVLRDFDRKQVVIYIDDILIMSRSYEEHLELVGSVLATLERYAIKINLGKCQWFQEEVIFLGHKVSRSGIAKADSYVNDVLKFPKPTTIKQLRSFLGLVNFQRKFIPNCSVVSRPLSKLMKFSDKKPLTWTGEMDAAFSTLKEAMAQDILLTYPDYSPQAEKLQLSTDASKYGAGACLTQVQEGVDRVIGYASTTFSPAEVNYCTLEQELAAIRWALKAFRGFLYGISFILFTDHRPLVYMHNMVNQKSRIMRTFNDLSEYHYEIKYKAGKNNNLADTLSRLSGLEPAGLSVSSMELPVGLQIVQHSLGGGDSMLHSLIIVLQCYKERYAPEMEILTSASDLREQLVTELESKPSLYGLKLDKCLKNTLKLAKLPGHLPMWEFLLAFSNLYFLQVWVHHGIDQPIIYDYEQRSGVNDAAKRVHLQCVNGIHYNPVSENNLYRPQILAESLQPADALSGDDQEDDPVGINTLFSGISQEELSCQCIAITGVPEVAITLEGLTFCALVDTGAQVSLVSEYVWDQLSEKGKREAGYMAASLPIRNFGESGVVVRAIVCLDVVIGGAQICKVPFGLVAAGSVPFCFILGLSFIQAQSLTVNFGNGLGTLNCDSERVSFTHTGLPHRSASYVYALCLSQNIEEYPDVRDLPRPGMLSYQQIRDLQGEFTMKCLSSKILGCVPPETWSLRCLRCFVRHASELRVERGILLWDGGEQAVPVVPFHFLVELAVQIHHQMSHIGRDKLIQLILGTVWHPDVHGVASDICTTCDQCQRYKGANQLRKPPVLKISTQHPFQLMAADLLQLPLTQGGYCAVLAVVDHCSKWLSVMPLRNKRASTVAAAFEHHILPRLLAVPRKLLTDNGAEFSSQVFDEVLNKYGIEHIHSTPYKPSSNGAIERLNRTLIQLLRSTEGDNSWLQNLGQVVVTYNNSWHASIDATPSQYLLKESHSVLPQPVLRASTKEEWRRGHPSFQPFRKGEQVLKRVVEVGNRTQNKFQPRFEGPYTITLVRDNRVTYELRDYQNRLSKAHHSQLKPYRSAPRYLRDKFRNIPSEPVWVPEDSSQSEPDVQPWPGVVPVGGETPPMDEFTSSSEESNIYLDFSGFPVTDGDGFQGAGTACVSRPQSPSVSLEECSESEDPPVPTKSSPSTSAGG